MEGNFNFVLGDFQAHFYFNLTRTLILIVGIAQLLLYIRSEIPSSFPIYVVSPSGGAATFLDFVYAWVNEVCLYATDLGAGIFIP